MSSGIFSFSVDIFGSIATLIFLTVFMCSLCFYYSKSLKKIRSYSELSRISFLIFVSIQWIRRNTYQILGPQYKKAVPFFICIISMFWFSNIISILGFKPLGSRIEIPACFALIVFIGTIISGLVYRGIHFFGDYFVWIKRKGKKIFPILDPLKLLGEVSKLLSLTCRLWGNTLAGSLILFVAYQFAQGMLSNENISYLGPILIPLFVFPLHIYFDIIDGSIQPLIFMILTMCYWAMARHGEGVSNEVSYDSDPEKG